VIKQKQKNAIKAQIIICIDRIGFAISKQRETLKYNANHTNGINIRMSPNNAARPDLAVAMTKIIKQLHLVPYEVSY